MLLLIKEASPLVYDSLCSTGAIRYALKKPFEASVGASPFHALSPKFMLIDLNNVGH